MTTAMKVLHRLRTRAPATGLTREFYTDEDIFALDLNFIFYREWLFAAHTAELPRQGSYVTLQIGAYPIVLVRAADGIIRAFINSCRHRGYRLCADAQGTASKLVCPYHQWTYNLDGRLFAARQMGSGFDRSSLGLKRVHCETVAGYIFVCLASEAPDFTPTRNQLEPYLAPHRIAEARVAFESTIVEEGNWKLVWENNRECYHCAANHPELARTYPDTPTITSVSGAAGDPKVVDHWQQCETLGLPSRLQLSDDGQLRTARMPLLGSAVSYTHSGQPAVNEASQRRAFCTRYRQHRRVARVSPTTTTWNHFLGDHAISLIVFCRWGRPARNLRRNGWSIMMQWKEWTTTLRN